MNKTSLDFIREDIKDKNIIYSKLYLTSDCKVTYEIFNKSPFAVGKKHIKVTFIKDKNGLRVDKESA